MTARMRIELVGGMYDGQILELEGLTAVVRMSGEFGETAYVLNAEHERTNARRLVYRART